MVAKSEPPRNSPSSPEPVTAKIFIAERAKLNTLAKKDKAVPDPPPEPVLKDPPEPEPVSSEPEPLSKSEEHYVTSFTRIMLDVVIGEVLHVAVHDTFDVGGAIGVLRYGP